MTDPLDVGDVSISITGDSNVATVTLPGELSSGATGLKGDKGDKGDKGEQGLPGTPADMSRVEALENSQPIGPYSKYAAPLFCEIKQISNTELVTSEICVPKSMTSEFVESTNIDDLLTTILSLLTTGKTSLTGNVTIDNALNETNLAKQRAIINYQSGIFVKELPQWEYCKKHGSNYDDFLSKARQEEWFNYYLLGESCVCLSTNPVSCIYSPVCTINNLMVALDKQLSSYNLTMLMAPFNSSKSAFQTKSKFKLIDNNNYGHYDDAANSKPLLAVINTLFNVATKNGSRSLLFYANPSSGYPDIAYPHDIPTSIELSQEGFSGITLEELSDEKRFIERCFGSPYNNQDVPYIDMFSCGNLQTDENFLGRTSKSDVTEMDVLNTADVLEKYNNSYYHFMLFYTLSQYCSWTIDIEASNDNCAKNNITTDSNSWEAGTLGPHWKYALYQMNPHSIVTKAQQYAESLDPNPLISVDTAISGNAMASIMNILRTHKTVINGKLHSGPGRVEDNKVSNYRPSVLKSNTTNMDPLVDDIDYLFDADSNKLLWSQGLIDALGTQIVLFGTDIEPNRPVTIIQDEALNVLFNGTAKDYYISEGSIIGNVVNYEPTGIYFLGENNALAYSLCCLGGSLGASLFHPSGKNIVKNGCSKVNSASGIEPNYFEIIGPEVLLQGNTVVLACPKPRDSLYVNKKNSFTGNIYNTGNITETIITGNNISNLTYNGVYSICDSGTFLSLTGFTTDYLYSLSNTSWTEYNSDNNKDDGNANIATGLIDRIQLVPKVFSFIMTNVINAHQIIGNVTETVTYDNISPKLANLSVSMLGNVGSTRITLPE